MTTETGVIIGASCTEQVQAWLYLSVYLDQFIRGWKHTAIPWPKPCPADPAAPDWANLQPEGSEKLADVMHWWIAERQLPDGQFGGGWGDDVDIWRRWVPVMIAFEHPVVTAAQERISSGAFQQPHLREGYTSRVTDVEHSNEDGLFLLVAVSRKGHARFHA